MDNVSLKPLLVETTKTFITDALNELLTVVEKPNWKDTLFYKRGNDTYQQISTRPDFSNIILNAEHEGKIFSLKTFAQFLSTNDVFLEMKNSIINQTKVEWDWLYPHFIAHDLLSEYLWLVDSLTYDENVSTDIAKNFVNFLYNPISHITFYSVLRGVNTTFDKIVFCDDVTIRKLPLDEISSLIVQNDSLHSEERAPENRVVLEESFEFMNGVFPSDIFSQLSKKFDFIVDALRLIKSGKVERENIYWRWDKPGQLGNRQIISSGRGRRREPG